MRAEITSKGSTQTSGMIYGRPVFTKLLHTSWGERVELREASPKAHTRQAFVFVRTHGQSRHWGEVFVRVRVPVSIPDTEAAYLAAHKARRKGVGYSWVMWARKRISEKYASLSDVAEFTQVLRNLTAEWCPGTSEEGRHHIEKVLKLGSFAASAFDTPDNSIKSVKP